MKLRKLDSFQKDFADLPKHIQGQASKKFKLLVQDIGHPSLRIKEMGRHKGIWEGHITRDFVFTFEKQKDNESGELVIVMRRIGSHSIYRKP